MTTFEPPGDRAGNDANRRTRNREAGNNKMEEIDEKITRKKMEEEDEERVK